MNIHKLISLRDERDWVVVMLNRKDSYISNSIQQIFIEFLLYARYFLGTGDTQIRVPTFIELSLW